MHGSSLFSMAVAVVMDKCQVPDRIFLFSGKRKSGKDYITDILHKRIGPERSVVIKISGPIKRYWAQTFKLELKELLSDRDYKEKYRQEMVGWSEDVRKLDYGRFCRAAVAMYKARGKRIWIVSDIRRKTDVRWFKENYGNVCRTIRISSGNKTREKRGWTFTEGIDDTETECDLDEVEDWDLTIINEDDSDIESILSSIMQLVPLDDNETFVV